MYMYIFTVVTEVISFIKVLKWTFIILNTSLFYYYHYVLYVGLKTLKSLFPYVHDPTHTKEH